MNKKWYCVHTNAGKEKLAEQSLKSAGYEVFFPWYLSEARHARQVCEVRKAYFPRYLFIGVEDQGIHAANNAMGVSTVLYGGDGPFEISRETIEEMQSRCDEAGRVYNGPKPDTQEGRTSPIIPAGTPVNITDGLLKGGEGVVYYDDGIDETVTVQMLMLGKRMVVPVRLDCLVKVRSLAKTG